MITPGDRLHKPSPVFHTTDIRVGLDEGYLHVIRMEYIGAIGEMWFTPTIDKERRPCYHKEKSGELVKQAERKSSNFDPLPDADNAAVGSHS